MEVPFRPRKAAIRASRQHVEARRSRRRAFALSVAGKVLFVTLLVAVCVLLCAYVNSAFAYVPLVFAVLAVVADFAYLHVLARFTSWRQEARVGSCPRGEDVDFRVRVENKSPLFVFHARAHFYVSDLFGGVAHDTPADIAMGPFRSEDHDITVRFEHLGTYSAGVDRIELAGFLGLFTRTVRASAPAEVHVTPTIHPIEHLGFATDTPSDSRVALKTVADDSLNYSGVREYRRGDALKRVHWGLSAKGTRKLLTKIFETPTNPGVEVVIDFTAPSGLTAEELMGMFDTVVEAAFSVDAYAHRTGLESELVFNDRHGQLARVRAWSVHELGALVDDMPRMQPGGDVTRTCELVRAEAASLYGQSNVVVCSANPASELVDAAIGVKVARRNPVFVCALPRGLTERERKRWLAPLERLHTAGVGYTVLEGTDAIGKVSL